MGARRNFSRRGKVEILLIVLRLLMMQCKWTFTKRFTLSTHWSALVEPQFSIFCLKCFLHVGYQKCFFF